LVNLRGELVGINTAIYNATGADVGIGFAIPVNMVRNIAEHILKYGEVRRGTLGVAVQDLTPDTIREHNLNADQTGAVIAGIERASAAEQAGLREGDVITAIGTIPVRNATDLRKKTRQFSVGEPVELGVLRDGHAITVRAILAAQELQAEK
jgi:serine protease DegQ